MNVDHYIVVSWDDIRKKEGDAPESRRVRHSVVRFEFLIKRKMSTLKSFRLCALAASAGRRRSLPRASTIMELFEVRVKRNWRSVVARPSDELLCLVTAAEGTDAMSAEYKWSVPSPFWVAWDGSPL